MNRLKICERYMTIKVYMSDKKRYWKAQKLHAKIISKNNKKWRAIKL